MDPAIYEMSDFYQHGTIATLHRLADPDMRKLEQELVATAAERPVALVLPSLYSELEGDAMGNIVQELAQTPYLSEIIISMNRMDAAQFARAREFFEVLPQKYRILWNDGPRVRKLYERLHHEKLTDYVAGKGYNVWMAYGLVLTDERIRVVATHDCDILSYHRDMLTRVLLPTAHPNLTYEYCKSYYTRVSDRMFGRVTRLFVFPLLRAMMKVAGPHPLLEFLNEFRYPLSGEFSISTDLARVIRVPGDWGLEIGLLCEVYRSATVRRICQVDIGSNFEHKHQPLGTVSNKGAINGLLKMVGDIARSLLRNLCAEGVQMTPAFMQSVRMTYERLAKENIGRYADDAFINGLIFVRHEESTAVEAFCDVLAQAQRDFMEIPASSPYIPSWNRVNSALPDFGNMLAEAVEEDNR